MPALISNEFQATFQVTPSVRELVREGKIRALAVGSPKRNSALPDTPTFEESGYSGYNDTIWFGMFAPSGTPDQIVGRMQAAVAEALSDPAMEEKYSALGMTTVGNKPDEFTADIANRIETWKAVIDKAGIVLPE
jgi:tripartite-type tricarboxylate transporter receptor subunit TctC